MSARDFFDDAAMAVRLATEGQRARYGFDDPVEWPPEARIAPTRVRLIPDEEKIEAVGITHGGSRFMLAAPSGFIALFLWTAEGEFDRIVVDDLTGTNAESEQTFYERRVAQLGVFTVEPIDVAPFAVEHEGTLFGLVPYESDADGIAWVEYRPGNAFALCWPWDGTYF